MNIENYIDNSGFKDPQNLELYNSIFNLCNGFSSSIRFPRDPAFLFLKSSDLFGLNFISNLDKNEIEFNSKLQAYIKKVSLNDAPENCIRLFLPETLIAILYIPSPFWHIPLGAFVSTQIKTELQKYFSEDIQEEGKEDGIKDFIFEQKKFGDTAIFEFSEYKAIIRTFILDYEKYKFQVPLEYLTVNNSQITGINDELQKVGKTFDYNQFCTSLANNLKLDI